MHPFAYYKPADLQMAATLFEQGADSSYLAGGMTLVPVLKQRLAAPDRLIDLGAIAALSGITLTAKTARVGAGCSHAALAAAPELFSFCPVLSQVAGSIGDPAVRNRGTIGGALANADPAADWPAAILGLGATLETDRRQIDGEAFFEGLFETALTPGEILTGIIFPLGAKAGYAKLRSPASGQALVGVLVARHPDATVRVAVTGAADSVFRCPELEAALADHFVPEAVKGIRVDAASLNTDIHASAAYRAHLIPVLAARAVAACR